MSRSTKEQLRQDEFSGNIQGHDIMDIARFFDDTRHMIVFDVIKGDCPVGFSGERIRIFLSNEGYELAVSSEERGEMIIRKHYTVMKGDLKFVSPIS